MENWFESLFEGKFAKLKGHLKNIRFLSIVTKSDAQNGQVDDQVEAGKNQCGFESAQSPLIEGKRNKVTIIKRILH